MITMAKPVTKHGFFDVPNLLPVMDDMVDRVKPKFSAEAPDSVGFISSGDVEINLEPVYRKKKKPNALKRKGKNTNTTKRKKRGKK